MESIITPPIEYPKVYKVNFFRYPFKVKDIINLGSLSLYEEFIEKVFPGRGNKLNNFLNKLDTEYPNFLAQVEVLSEIKSKQENQINFFIIEDELKDNVNQILVESREGDILDFEDNFLYYISGFNKDRALHKLIKLDEGTWILPYEANVIIEEYDIRNIEDVNRYYPGLNIDGIRNDEGRITFFK